MHLTKTDVLGISMFLVLGSCVFQAKADTFVEVGQSTFNKPFDSLWWQDGYPNAFDLTGSYVRFGAGDTFRVWGYDLGRYRSEALATNEIMYYSGRCNVKTCPMPDYYGTTGTIRGLGASVTHKLSFVTFEAGAIWAHQTFDLVIDRRPRGGSVYEYSESRDALGYMAGVSLEYKAFSLNLHYWDSRKAASFKDGEFPAGVNKIRTISVGYRF